MSIEIRVPSPGESISEVQLAAWLVEEGDQVEKDQEVAEIDSDKATLTINAEEAGRISLKAKEGDTLEIGAVIAVIDTDVKGEADSKAGKKEKEPKEEKPEEKEPKEEKPKEPAGAKEEEAVKETPAKKQEEKREKKVTELHISPLAKKLLEEQDMSEEQFVDLLKGYRVTKKDVEFFLENKAKQPAGESRAPKAWGGTRDTARKKMSMLRMKVAERLVSVKNETALLTTFNEVNMKPIMDLRSRYKDAFKEKFGVSLGFMSLFTKAVTEAFTHFPEINARLEGDEIVYHNYADIGIAVSTPKGLMVPVIRNAETLSLAEIESAIKELAVKARDNKISIDEMQGGTFTITNGGVFGSMLSTPIVNPPQSAILGMHNIVDRPVAIEGKVEIHPVMYLALSYDHRVIDGRESVSFLVKVKEILENPIRMLHEGEDPVTRLLGL